MRKRLIHILLSAFALSTSMIYAKDEQATPLHRGPEAGGRTYAQNYKDMVLAECIATAYRNEPEATKDAGSSVTALIDWTYYDMEKSIDAIKMLVNSYLARDYFNPLVEAEIKGVRFDFLKCLDLYHSKELEAQVKRFVINPKRTYRQDTRPPAKQK